MSEADQRPRRPSPCAALFKAPTGDDVAGVSTGQGRLRRGLHRSARSYSRSSICRRSRAMSFAVQPDGFDIPTSAFRWGTGDRLPVAESASRHRRTERVATERRRRDASPAVTLVATDGSISPLVSATENITRLNLGATWQHGNGFFLGGGLGWNLPTRSRDGFTTDSDPSGDFVDWQVRLGYHPGVRRYRAAAATASAAASSTAATAACRIAHRSFKRSAIRARSKSAGHPRSRPTRAIPTAIN